MPKIGTAINEMSYYYNARNNFIAREIPLTSRVFKDRGAAFAINRARGGSSYLNSGINMRTHLDNGYNTGNPLTPGTIYQRQDISTSIFARDYYISIQNNQAVAQYTGYTGSYFDYSQPSSKFNSLEQVIPTPNQNLSKFIRAKNTGLSFIDGTYFSTSNPSEYIHRNGAVISNIDGIWTITYGSVAFYVASTVVDYPWQVPFWFSDYGPETLLVEDDIREFTFGPLLNFVANTVGVKAFRYCNIFARIAFDQYCILGTRWIDDDPDGGRGIRERPILQRSPCADLAYVSFFKVYYNNARS